MAELINASPASREYPDHGYRPASLTTDEVFAERSAEAAMAEFDRITNKAVSLLCSGDKL
jgi:hypothetical protein